MRYYRAETLDSPVVQIHIADIHFGAIDPEVQYNILAEQFLRPISTIHFDILSIDGDLFDKKFLASSPAVTYAMRFILDCVDLCLQNYATLVILSGTESHDAGQLSLFYGLNNNSSVTGLDIRIVEHIQFEYIKGLKILCIPEEYGKPVEYYTEYLCNEYDAVFMHGTIQGAVYGANKYNLDSKKAPVFALEAFSGCRGPIIAGHVHKAMCLNSYMYYVSNPIRYRFGEEEEKGYAIVVQSNQGHYYQFMPIMSFRYDTIDINSITYSDPNMVIEYLDQLKAKGIDHIRIDFSSKNDPTTQELLEKYYASDSNVVIKRYHNSENPEVNTTEEIENKYSDMDFLINPQLDSYTKFVMFINHNEGKEVITVDQLKSILSGKFTF